MGSTPIASTTREPDEPSVLHQREEPHRFAVRLFPFHLIASLSHEIKQHVDVLTDGAEIVSSAAPTVIVPDAAAHLIQELFLPHQNGEARQQSADHPILWGVEETSYLKFYLFQVV